LSLFGLDTNVLLRFLVDDGDPQCEMVRRELDEKHGGDEFFVGTIVLCEFFWVCERVLRLPRPQIVETLFDLLDVGAVQVEEEAIVRASLEEMGATGADFADALICNLNMANGCAATLTLDKAAGRLDGMKLLKC